MPKQRKICRVCGAEYEACQSVRTGSKAFNWREVACSPECGMEYLDRITASRSIVEPIEESGIMRFPLNETVEESEVQTIELPDDFDEDEEPEEDLEDEELDDEEYDEPKH